MSDQFQDVVGVCERCGGSLAIGIAIEQTFTAGMPDFPGQADTDGQTISPGGPGKLKHVIKCKGCGASWYCASEPYQGPKTIGPPLPPMPSEAPPVEEERRYRDISEWESEGAFMSWLHKADEDEFPFWLKDGNSSYRITEFDRVSIVRGILIGMSWSTREKDEEE